MEFYEISEHLTKLLTKLDGGAALVEGSTAPELQVKVKNYLKKAQAAKGRGDKTAAKYWDDRMKFAANKLHKMQNSPAGSPSAAKPTPSAPASTSTAPAKRAKPGSGHKGNSFKAIGHEIAKHLHKAVVKAGGHAVGKIPFLSQGKLGKHKIPGLMRKSTAQKLGRKLTGLALNGAGKVASVAGKLAAKGGRKITPHLKQAAKGAAALARKGASGVREKGREMAVQRSFKKDQKRATARSTDTSKYRKNTKLASKGAKDYRKKQDSKKAKHGKTQTKLADKGAADFRVKMQQKMREKQAELQHHKHQAKMQDKEHKVELKKKDKDFKLADKAAGDFKKIAQKHSSAADRMRKEIDKHHAMTKINPKLIKHAQDRFHHVRKGLGNLFKVTKNKLKQGAFGHQVKAKVQRATDRLRQRYTPKHAKTSDQSEPDVPKHPDIAA